MTVTNKGRPRLAALPVIAALDFKIEHADTIAGLSLINASIARPDHHSRARFFLSAKIDHGVRNWRIPFDRIGAGPKKQIAWL